jgi:hypothetical protein
MVRDLAFFPGFIATQQLRQHQDRQGQQALLFQQGDFISLA